MKRREATYFESWISTWCLVLWMLPPFGFALSLAVAADGYERKDHCSIVFGLIGLAASIITFFLKGVKGAFAGM